MNSQSTSQEKLLRRSFFADLKIGAKLGLGFGVLVALIFFSAVVSYTSSAQATTRIQKSDDVLVPAALTASQAQADLLRMLSDVRGYLALGDAIYRDSYLQSAQAFEANLAKLEEQSSDLDPSDQARLKELRKTYEQWRPLPEQLFELRDDQLDREPAYRMLATDGVEHAGNVIIALNQMIAEQSKQTPSVENMAIMDDMSKFQGNFLAMLSALRGYVTTRNPVYRYEYGANKGANDEAWSRLLQDKSKLTKSQQQFMADIGRERQSFLIMPDEIFKILESTDYSWRKDLYLFNTEAVPLADQMDKSLSDLVKNQQNTLRSELSSGRRSLEVANLYIIGSGIVALLFGLIMAYASRSAIALPIGRLTHVAEQIREGALDTQAKVESRDEIGILAATFNNMTSKLRSTLFQVRKEKKRADDLLEVVIPIGVELTTEKDFNRLLEKMLLEAKSFCNADMGMLYLRPSQEKNELKYVIVRSDSLQIALGGTTGNVIPFGVMPLMDSTGAPNHRHLITHVALSGVTANIEDASQSTDFDYLIEQEELFKGYSVKSLLAIPLKNSANQVLGVIQLINPKDAVDNGETIIFDPNLQQMMESFSSLAVAALEAYIREQSLRAEVAQLRIEIDQAKRQKQVGEIVESEFFRDLKSKVQNIRGRQKGGSENKET